MRAVLRRGRAVLAGVVVCGVLGVAMFLSPAAAWAESGGSAETEEINPEQYPAPPSEEKTVPPKPPVQTPPPPELVRTGVELPWQVFAVTGAGLLALGGGLLIARRRLSQD